MVYTKIISVVRFKESKFLDASSELKWLMVNFLPASIQILWNAVTSLGENTVI